MIYLQRIQFLLSNITVIDMDVYEALASLDATNSPGNDLIGPNILKYGALSLYCPVHHLFTLCLSKNSFIKGTAHKSDIELFYCILLQEISRQGRLAL